MLYCVQCKNNNNSMMMTPKDIAITLFRRPDQWMILRVAYLYVDHIVSLSIDFLVIWLNVFCLRSPTCTTECSSHDLVCMRSLSML